MRHVIAVDLGGTKLATAMVDENGKVRFRRSVPVERAGPDRTIHQITDAIQEAVQVCRQEGVDVSSCGIIVPGIYFASTGYVWAPNLWGHQQIPLRSNLEKNLGLPVLIDSDRAGYVLGERWRGAARGLNDVVFLAVGTGIGAGIISGGRLLRGGGDIAGAVGWFALPAEKSDLFKQVGCWEAEAAGPALARRVQASSAEAVVTAARAGDEASLRAVGETARMLGIGIANLVSLLNPEMIVLGGGLMQAADLFLPGLRAAMREWAQPVAAEQVRIEITRLGGDAGLLGAARLALEAAA